MKKLLFILLLFGGKTFAQFAKIVDKDGYVNVRNAAGSKARIVGTIKSGEMVYIFNKGNDDGSWMIVDYQQKNGNLLTGYVHISRLQEINSYEQIPSLWDDETGTEFEMRNFHILIKTRKFDEKINKKYLSGTDDNPKYKGQEMWGTDGTMPKTQYQSITASIGNQNIEIPQKDLENLFNVVNENVYCYYDDKTDTLYITSINSDGAGSYEVLFIIEKGKYKGRRVYNAD